MNRFVQNLHKIDGVIFARPWMTLAVILLVTVFFALQIPAVRMVSDFADLLPQEHPYIKLHNEIRDTFGGANNIIVALEVENGTIFTNETLNRIHRITQAVDSLPGINHNLVTSLTHRTTRKIWLNEAGTIKSTSYYDPRKGDLTDAELNQLSKDVAADRGVYGLLVSPNLSAALVNSYVGQILQIWTFHTPVDTSMLTMEFSGGDDEQPAVLGGVPGRGGPAGAGSRILREGGVRASRGVVAQLV